MTFLLIRECLAGGTKHPSAVGGWCDECSHPRTLLTHLNALVKLREGTQLAEE